MSYALERRTYFGGSHEEWSPAFHSVQHFNDEYILPGQEITFLRSVSAVSGLLLEGSEPCNEVRIGHLDILVVPLGTFLHI